ncbi:Enoyl-CoA hydratase [Oceanobacillus limi]|uniref:Enoyl-CoA hydratase n=1 Tax=Oceanobacillus limi TaxID=930131 RepID=A0A1H9YJP8_9BACI|nr:enoyl-CoA hydratase-related protein [Oceanobacillus limi]SES69291.1 Enoyl-CoA hydratase [Oceanobacillus limi]
MTTVQFESEDGISYIRLNRPERYNALDKKMLEDLLEVIEKVENNHDRIVILSGNGNAFCAGGDISMMKEFSNQDVFGEIMDTIGLIVRKLYVLNKIVISAVQGSAAGLGLSLALTADYVIGQNESKFGMLFLGVGLAPDGGGHFWLEQRLGAQRAKQFIWGMKQVQGQVAKSMGLVDILTNKSVVEEATRLGQKLLTTPTIAMLKTKQMYHSKNVNTLDFYLKEEKNRNGTYEIQQIIRKEFMRFSKKELHNLQENR